MRILTSLTYYLPHISGLTYHAQMIAQGLSQQGHHITVLCLRHDPLLPLTETCSGIHIIRAKPLFAVSKGFFSLDWFRQVVKLVPQHDKIIIHLPQPESVFLGLVSKIFRKRLVVFYHCDLFMPPGLINWLIQKTVHLSHLITLSLADVILHSTQDYAQESPALKKFLPKIKYCYPPIPQRPSVTTNHPQSGTYVIGFLGRLASEKGLEYLIQALPFIKTELRGEKFKLHLAGPKQVIGEQKYRCHLTLLIEANQDLIDLKGPLSENQIAGFFQSLHLLVLPSVNSTESFGTVQVEAMTQGTPVVASDLPGVRQPVLITGYGQLCEPRNPESLARQISEVLLHPHKYRPNPTRVQQIFKIQDTLKVYTQALGV